MSFQVTNGRFQALLNGGAPLVGGRLYTYVSGTTTFKATYTDASLATTNTYVDDGSGGQFIALNARGEAPLWLGSGAYTLTLKDSTGVQIWSGDGYVDPGGALQVVLSGLDGAGGIGYGTSQSYDSDTVGWAIQTARDKFYVREQIPTALWATLMAGTETTDMGPYINAAVAAAAPTGGVVVFDPWTYCVSTPIQIAGRAIALDGGVPKYGVPASAAMGCCLKWTGTTGATMVEFVQGAHNPSVSNITFAANDKADTCLSFTTNGGATPQILFQPRVYNCRFDGYRGAAVVFGNKDTTVFDTGQLQQAEMRGCVWNGGGATATVANVVGVLLNAENMEILTLIECFFDPFTVPFGGPNIDHQNHILVKTGGLHVLSSTMTRADGNDINVLGECGLVIDQVRTEDPLFLIMAAGFPSNPVSIRNVQGRDGTSTGNETFMSIGCGGGQSVSLENIHSTGNIIVFAADENTMRVRGITYMHPGVSSLSLSGSATAGAVYDLEDTPGMRSLTSATPDEIWEDLSGNVQYRNHAGALRLKSLQNKGASADGANLFGEVTVTGTNTSATATFGTAESDTAYSVVLTVNSVDSGAAASSNRVASVTKSTSGFTVNLEAAPGGTKNVTFAWMIFRH